MITIWALAKAWEKTTLYNIDKDSPEFQKILEILETNDIDKIWDIPTNIDTELDIVEGYVSIEENKGYSTLELYNKGELIWDNSTEIKETKSSIIKIIKDRVEEEHKKYKTILPDEWIEIAAHKIFNDLKTLNYVR